MLFKKNSCQILWVSSCWVLQFLYFYQYSRTLFWDKLFGKCLILSGTAFKNLINGTISMLTRFSTTEARPFWVLYPMPHESWGFPVCLVEEATIPNPMGALGTLPPNSFEWFFLLPQLVAAHAWADQYSAKYSRGPSVHLWSSFSVHYSLLSGTLSYKLHLLHLLRIGSVSSTQFAGCHLGSLSSILAGKLFRAVSLVIITIGLISFFSSWGFTAFHWLVSSVLKTIASYIACHWLFQERK